MGFFSFKCQNSQVSSFKQPHLSNHKVSKRAWNPNFEEMRKVFKQFDSNKDGKISREEYKLATRALGKVNVEKAFQIMDTDRDGFIDFNEFMEVQNNGGEGERDDIIDAFRTYDLDGNGKISPEELMAVMRKLGERCSLKTCQKMVKGADLDGDGLIDTNEFMTMMTKTSKIY